MALTCLTRWIHFYPRSPCGERLVCRNNVIWKLYFYPRSPCGERHSPSNQEHPHTLFLSTLSLRRATAHPIGVLVRIVIFLSTLSLRRATDGLFFLGRQRSISIHALLAESDRADYNKSMLLHLFLSTLSLRRATSNIIDSNCNLTHFYPRSPCGERLLGALWVLSTLIFLSTLSLRRATQ